jgi:hypothetical protein
MGFKEVLILSNRAQLRAKPIHHLNDSREHNDFEVLVQIVLLFLAGFSCHNDKRTVSFHSLL